MLMRGLLKSYDTISLENINKSLSYMKKCIDAHIEVVYTFTKAFYDDYFLVMDRMLGKLYLDI